MSPNRSHTNIFEYSFYISWEFWSAEMSIAFYISWKKYLISLNILESHNYAYV